eukprot:4075151-Pleurochrysis_carterae.AAC.1
MRVKTEEGGCNWTNDLVGRKNLIIDQYMLEDLCEFHGATYEIKQGYYWDDSNARISEVMADLYEKRLMYKKAKNAIQLVFKLLMNSSYGITGLKPVVEDTRYIESTEPDTQQRFISQNYDQIKYFTDLKNGSMRYVLQKETIEHLNRQHVACMILSYSKRIMNRVMYLAEDNGIPIYYQDTDSMHLPDRDVERLEQLYKQRYNRTLNGVDYGQFSSDFETGSSWIYDENTERFRKAGGDIRAQGEVVAKQSIFLGKKSYLDLLTDSHNSFTSYHIRMKGIPTP